jgi:predicted GTPase
MSRWRIIVVLVLIVAPVVFLAGVGSYSLWERGLSFSLWWPMALCVCTGYLLAWHWHRKKRLLAPLDFSPPFHWTERDRQAWQIVEARAKDVAKLTQEQMTTFDFYVETAKEMSIELARYYHPQAADPWASLTIPELLAVIELAAHDMSELVDKYLPGGHLLTIQDLRRARSATEWYSTASTVYWGISAVLSPITTGLRYVASNVGLSRPLQLLQQNLLAWFYTAYLQRVGCYLIDLNSGRLRIGVRRYRELVRKERDPDASTIVEASLGGDVMSPPGEVEAAEAISVVQVTMLGQVKAGKSSLVNALLGEQRTRTDVLPATGTITRYELKHAEIPTKLVLLDTVGYAHTGPRADQLAATQEAAKASDLLILVLHARNPARQADLELLRKLRAWFDANPNFKKPPILAVLTHIDLLSPALEWAPPYDWQEGKRPKEQYIHQALDAVMAPLGEYLVGCVPVCSAEGKVYGIEDWLLPAIANQLDEAHGVALLRCLHAEIDTGKIRKVFRQTLAAGKQLAKVVWGRRPM